MTRFRIRPLCLAVSLVLTMAAAPVWAQSSDRKSERDDGPSQARAQQDRYDRSHDHDHDHERELSDAVRRVVREQRGRVLSAERVQYEGREVNRIKVIDDQGRVRVYVDDPHGNDRRDRTSDPP